MNNVEQHIANVDFGSKHLNETAKKILELFAKLDEKEQEKALWMIQGYSLGQKKDG